MDYERPGLNSTWMGTFGWSEAGVRLPKLKSCESQQYPELPCIRRCARCGKPPHRLRFHGRLKYTCNTDWPCSQYDSGSRWLPKSAWNELNRLIKEVAG